MERLLAVLNVFARIALIFGLALLLPIGVSWWTGDGALGAFDEALVGTLVIGGALLLATQRFRRELRANDGVLLVVLCWVLLPLIAALPLLLGIPEARFSDVYFEAVSGLTATGATAFSGLDRLPPSINLWRTELHWIGGLGIIVLAVAILPLLGVGGAQLFKTEMTGPMKDARLTPRIAETARGLWTVYFVGCVACFFAYHWAGMSWADAFMHMCSTMSLAGFSSHDASFGYWDSPLIEAVAVVFMMLAGISVALYFVAWRQRSLRPLWHNVEARAFGGVMAGAVLLISLYLWHAGTYPSYAESLRHTVFHVVSVGTTTGYATRDYAQWPQFAPLLLLLIGCFATCGGSTGGGIKMMRMLLLLKQAQHELVRIVHPSVVNPVVVSGQVIAPRTMQNIIAFMMVYGATLVVLTMLMVASGQDVVTAFTAIVACLNNIGPGLGKVGPALNYASLSDFQTWVCTFAMMLGRLELLSLLVLFTPQFWRG